ncbi:MAG: thermopsin family protease, partial [Caldivirga sp.]|nr:thermopsin family protease [Caldivirga sp.]
MLNATGIDTGWVRYDSVIVMDESTEAYITVGGFNPGGLSNDIEWVVAGYTAAAQLYVYYWNATAILMYEHDGHWYVPPSAQTRSFDTGESVNGVYGIREIYNELRGFVMQINGTVNNTYLWVPRAIASYSNGFLIIQPTPSGGKWITTIINPRGVAHRLSGSALRVKVNGTGRYIINVTLYAGNMSIVTYSYVVLVKGVEPWLQTTLLLIPLAAAVVLLVKLLGARHGQGL